MFYLKSDVHFKSFTLLMSSEVFVQLFIILCTLVYVQTSFQYKNGTVFSEFKNFGS